MEIWDSLLQMNYTESRLKSRVFEQHISEKTEGEQGDGGGCVQEENIRNYEELTGNWNAEVQQ